LPTTYYAKEIGAASAADGHLQYPREVIEGRQGGGRKSFFKNNPMQSDESVFTGHEDWVILSRQTEHSVEWIAKNRSLAFGDADYLRAD
jgi:hypothetical protein